MGGAIYSQIGIGKWWAQLVEVGKKFRKSKLNFILVIPKFLAIIH